MSEAAAVAAESVELWRSSALVANNPWLCLEPPERGTTLIGSLLSDVASYILGKPSSDATPLVEFKWLFLISA